MRVDPHDAYRRAIGDQEVSIARLRSQLQRLATTAPQPNEAPRNVMMPMLEAEYRMAEARLGLLRAHTPRGDEWPAEWTIRLHEMVHHQNSELDVLARGLGLQVHHRPDQQQRRQQMQQNAALAYQQMARRHQQEHEERVRRAEETRRLAVDREVVAVPPDDAAIQPVVAAPPQQQTPPPVPLLQQPIPRQPRVNINMGVGEQNMNVAVAADIVVGNNNNNNNNLNLNLNMGPIGVDPAGVPAFPEAVGHVVMAAHRQAHANVVVQPRDSGTFGTILSKLSSWPRTYLEFDHEWSQQRFYLAIAAFIMAIETAMLITFHGGCHVEVPAEWEWSNYGAVDGGPAPYNVTALQEKASQMYEECIADPFVSLGPVLSVILMLMFAVFSVPLRRQPAIFIALISALASVRVTPSPVPRTASVLSRVLFRLALAITGGTMPDSQFYPPSALRFGIVVPLVQLAWVYISLPRYYERTINMKWMQARVAQFTGRLGIFTLFWGMALLTVLTLSDVAPMYFTHRHLLECIVLLPSVVAIGVPIVSTLVEVHVLAGSWAQGAKSSYMQEWMWWVHSAMQFTAILNIDQFALFWHRIEVLDALKASIEGCTGDDEISLRMGQRVIPLELLNRCRVRMLGNIQATLMSMLGWAIHSNWLWAILPVGSVAVGLMSMWSPVWLEALVVLMVVPVMRLVLFPLPQEYLGELACGNVPPDFSTQTLGPSLDGYRDYKVCRPNFVARALYQLTDGFRGSRIGYKLMAVTGVGRVPVALVVEDKRRGGDAPPTVTRTTWDVLGIDGESELLRDTTRSAGVLPTDRCPRLSAPNFLAYINFSGSSARQGGDGSTRASPCKLPHHNVPFEALFGHLAEVYAPIGAGMDDDRDVYVAVLQVLNVVLRSGTPDKILERLLRCDAFIQLVHLACCLCGHAAGRPPTRAPFHQRRLPCVEWVSAQTDHEVMAQMLPTSGMLMQLAVYCLDNDALQAHGVGVTKGTSDAAVEDFLAERRSVDPSLASEQVREGLQAQRQSLRQALAGSQRSLATCVWSNAHRLCQFITSNESLFDGVDGKSLPPFVLRPDAAHPQEPSAVSITVEAITVREHTTLNMRGIAAQLLAALLAWDGSDEDMLRVEAIRSPGGNSADGGSIMTVQRRVELSGALSGKDQHPLQSLTRFTKAVLFVTAKRRFLKVMTTSYYGGMLELLAVLMLPSGKPEGGHVLSSASPGSSWVSSTSDARMYHRTGDASLMPDRPYPSARLPFKVRPYDSTMRVYDLLLQLFDAEHWVIMAQVALDPLTQLSLHRADRLAAAVLGQALPPPRARNVPPGNIKVLDDATMRQVIRGSSAQSALALVPKVWVALQQRILNQLTMSQFKTAMSPDTLVSESRALQHTMLGYLMKMEGLVGVATAALRSDVDGYGMVCNAARAHSQTSLGQELRAALLPAATSLNGLLLGSGGNKGLALGGVLDPYALLLDQPLQQLFGLGVTPAGAFVRFPNSDTQPMATRAVRYAPQSIHEMLLDAEVDPILQPVTEPHPPGGDTHGRPDSHSTPAEMTAVRPVGAASGGVALRTRSLYVSPLDVHRWALLALFTHPSHAAGSWEAKVRARAMCRRLLLGFDLLHAAASAHACHDKGFVPLTDGDAADVCTICLEVLDGHGGRWSDDGLLTLSECEGLGRLPRRPTAGVSARLLSSYLGRMPDGLQELALKEQPHDALADAAHAMANPTMRTACGHTFHLRCLVGLLRHTRRGQGRCPMCRSVLAEESPMASVSSPPQSPAIPPVPAAPVVVGGVGMAEQNIVIAPLD